MNIVLKNGMVYTKNGFYPADISIADGHVVSVAQGVDLPEGSCSIDIHGAVVFPGLVDVHVHLREPGFSYKETIRTGTLAAAHGGFTHVCAMPNLDPVPDTEEHLREEWDAIERDALVHVYPYGSITMGEKGETLAELDAMAQRAVAFSDDGKGVQSPDMMESAMREAKRLGKMIVAHCEDNSLLRGGYIHDGTYARLHGHRGICSESEWGPIKRDILLAEKTGCPYHVCHISTEESVELVRAAKKRGVDVTCEVGPHYLVYNDMDLEEDGRFKMNPPLRSEADRLALIRGVQDGTIDMVITDHAPHSSEEKSRGLEKSAMGVVGLETSFAACYTHLVKTGLISLERLMELMHDAPMRRFGIGSDLVAGAPADLTVFDLNRSYRVDPEKFLTMGRATPFAGETLYGVCTMTMVDGNIVWQENET